MELKIDYNKGLRFNQDLTVTIEIILKFKDKFIRKLNCIRKLVSRFIYKLLFAVKNVCIYMSCTFFQFTDLVV